MKFKINTDPRIPLNEVWLVQGTEVVGIIMTHSTYCPANPDYVTNLVKTGGEMLDLGNGKCECNHEPTNNEIYCRRLDLYMIFAGGGVSWRRIFRQGRTTE